MQAYSYVPVHLEYILTEILKNSYRATVEHHLSSQGSSARNPLPDISITIAPPTSVHGDGRPRYLSLRVRDRGGGVPQENIDRIFSYAFTTAGRNAHQNHDEDSSGGPYAAQAVGGSAALANSNSPHGEVSLFGEITSKGLQTGLGTIAGLGYGCVSTDNTIDNAFLNNGFRLPMARLYANYFGGSLQLVSLHGYGADCFIKLRSLESAMDISI